MLQLAERCKADELSEELLKLTLADVKLGRMAQPVGASTAERKGKSVSPRFAVEQGVKPDGSRKIRPVHDFTASGCNKYTVPT